jgi:hypothetical protein
VGATLSAGTNNADGTYTLTQAQLTGLTLNPGANWHGDATLTVTATSTESSNGSSASTTANLALHVTAIAAAPAVTATDATGNTGDTIGLHVAAALTDPTEHLGAVIGGVPNDATLSAGLNNGDGTWTLTPAQLAMVQITPSDHFTGDLALSMTAYSRDDNGSGASTTQNFSIHVMAATAPVDATFATGSWINATTNASGGAPSATATTPAQEAHDAINAASAAAHAAGSDYQHAFQSHQTG